METLSKGEMINEILGAIKNAAFLQNKHVDLGDKFISLAFMDESDLKTICKKLRIIK